MKSGSLVVVITGDCLPSKTSIGHVHSIKGLVVGAGRCPFCEKSIIDVLAFCDAPEGQNIVFPVSWLKELGEPGLLDEEVRELELV